MNSQTTLMTALCLGASVGMVHVAEAGPVGSGFTYQGELKQGGTLYSGNADFTFRLFDAAVAGAQVGGDLLANALAVADGRFTVDLDFGSVYDGTSLWLEIVVDGTTLTPRQPLMATPFAAFALNGNAGPQGADGPAGPEGPTGPQGNDGAAGATGPQGNDGAPGATGPQGNDGPQGATGPQGNDGPQGATGLQGNDGPQGATGSQGNDGPQGVSGPQGATGPQGPVGPAGTPGDSHWTVSGSATYYTGGNVGVGTSNPIELFQVSDDLYVDGPSNFVGVNRNARVSNAEYFGIQAPASGTSYGGMYIQTDGDQAKAFYGYAVGSKRSWSYLDGATGELRFYHSNADRLTISNIGNVGIGSTPLNSRFSVIGLQDDPSGIGGSAATFDDNSLSRNSPTVYVEANSDNAGTPALEVFHKGRGSAGSFRNTASDNVASAVSAVTMGSGNALYAETQGNGATALFIAGAFGSGTPLIAQQSTSAVRNVALFRRFSTTVASINNYGLGTFSGGVNADSVNTTAMVADRSDNAGNIIEAKNGTDIEFRVASVGDVFCDGSFTGGGADYAEWLERLSASDDLNAGDVVGVFGGRIAKQTRGADQVLVISTNPVLIGNGNGAESSERDGYEIVAFIGQAPVNVRGQVQVGDFIVASGRNDGTAIAVRPAAITAAQLEMVIGTAWEANGDRNVKLVNVAVGVDQVSATSEVIERLQKQLDDRDRDLDAMHNRMLDLEAMVAQLAERL